MVVPFRTLCLSRRRSKRVRARARARDGGREGGRENARSTTVSARTAKRLRGRGEKGRSPEARPHARALQLQK